LPTLLLFVSLLLTTSYAAEVERHVFPVGARTASSKGYEASVTVGEVLTGVAENGGFSALIGFQYEPGNLAPTGILLPISAVEERSPVTITAELQDDVGITEAILYYRVGGAPAFSQIEMTEVEGEAGQWEATIPPESVTEKGIQHYVQASDGELQTTLPHGAPSIVFATLIVEVSDLPAFDLPAERYQLLGLPISPETADPLAVFDDLGGYDTDIWRYGTYNGSDYDEPPFAEAPLPGQGFWLISRESINITASGFSTALDTNFPISLREGWNQIANPFAFPVDFDNLILPEHTEANLISWDHEAGSYRHNQTVLEPSRGYWIKHNGATTDMEIPPIGSGGGLKTLPHVTAAGESGWSIHVEATAGRFGDTGNRFGMRPGATSGKDVMDFSDAPAPPTGHVSLSFLLGEEILLTDYRRHDSYGESWEMVLQSDQEDAQFEVTLGQEGDLPAGWEAVVIDATSLLETDLVEETTIRGHVSSASFEHTWHIAAGPPSYLEEIRGEIEGPRLAQFALGTVSPNPFRVQSGTSFSLFIPHDAEVTLRIVGLGGQVVRSLLRDRLERGVHRIPWDGSNDGGSTVSAGVYFVQMRAPNTSVVRKIVLLR
jgi:hypothetical protein